MPGVELGSAFVPIRADLDPLKKDLNSAHDSIAGKLGGAMKAAAGAMALGGIAAGGALVAIGASATQAASDVNESLSKVGVVFGDNAKDIEAWAATAATSMGQSRGEALAAAGTLGNLFVAMGVGSKDAAGLSTEMIELAGDLGSFNNIASSDALEKLRAGLIGEAEPLRALGVNMNAAMVEAKGMELGLADANGELSEAAKVQARYAIIMEQTKTAQGDFARTSDGMANATKIIKASMADLQVQIGDQLLPIIAPLIASFAKWLPTAIAAAQPILVEVGRVFGELMVAVGLVFESVSGLATGWQASTADVSEQTAVLWRYVEPILSALASNLAVFWEEIFPELQQTWTAVVEGVQRVTAAFGLWWDEHWTTISKVLDVAMVVITAVIDTAFSSIKTLISVVLNLIQGDWQGAWDAIRDHFGVVWGALQRVVSAAMPLIQEVLAHAWTQITGEFIQTWENIKSTLNGALETLKTAFYNAGPALLGLLKQGLDAAWGGVIANVQGGLGRVAALLPHSLAEEGPLSKPVSWRDVLWGDLRSELPAVVATISVGTDLIEDQFEELTVAVRAQRMGIDAELLALTDSFAATAASATSALAAIEAVSESGGGGGGGGWNPVSSNDLAAAMASYTNQTHAAMLTAGTVASGLGAGGQVGAGIFGAQAAEVHVEIDGYDLARVLAPVIEPRIVHAAGTHIPI